MNPCPAAVPNAEKPSDAAPPEKASASEPSSVEPSVEAVLLRVAVAMENQTRSFRRLGRAIERLAASNEEIVNLLVNEQAPDDDPGHGLDLSNRPLNL